MLPDINPLQQMCVFDGGTESSPRTARCNYRFSTMIDVAMVETDPKQPKESWFSSRNNKVAR
jgi:hypothetical protein